MILTYFGHSCFTLETDQGKLVIDPYRNDVLPGYQTLTVSADAVYCTHEHRDHAGREQVTLSGKTPEVKVQALQTFHDDTQGSQRGENTIYIFSCEGLRVAHLGDLGCDPTPEQKQILKNLDAVLIPVGGFYTIDAKQAAKLLQEITPRVTIPMHYRTTTKGFDVIATLDEFLVLRDDVIRYDTNTFTLDQTTPAQTAVLSF